MSQASQSQVSWLNVESANARLSALRLQPAVLISLRQQHGWPLPCVTARTAGSLQLCNQTTSQGKPGETRRAKQVSSTDGVPLIAVTYSR